MPGTKQMVIILNEKEYPVYPKFNKEGIDKIKKASNMIGCKALSTFCEIAAIEKSNRILNENKFEDILGKVKNQVFNAWEKGD